jgi:hypothetical protein
MSFILLKRPENRSHTSAAQRFYYYLPEQAVVYPIFCLGRKERTPMASITRASPRVSFDTQMLHPFQR